MIARCKFLVASLHNVNEAAHSMAQSIRIDCLKITRTEVGINLEVNWPCLCHLANEIYSFNLSLNHREIWSPKCRLNQNF